MMATASWRFGGFELDPVDRRLMRDGTEISVPPKTFDVLAVLLRNAGRLVKREELFHAVWNGVEVEHANLTNNITILRKILGQRCIVSVPRHGYRFRLPVAESVGLSPEASQVFAEAQTLLSQRQTESVLKSRDLL